MNFLPADFFEDGNSSKSSKFSSSQYARKAKALANSNKIAWDEKFDWALQKNEMETLSELKREFANDKCTKKELQGIIKNSLGSWEDPHKLILKFCINLKECDINSLGYLLLETLCTEFKGKVSNEVKVHAFNHFSQMPRMALKIAIKAFRLQESKDMFKEKIMKIAKNPWVNQAAIVAIEFNICDEFPIEDILIPLFLENKTSTYLDYIDKAFTLQLPMIKYLDSLMESKYEYENELKKYNIKRVEIKNQKVLKAHIFKMCKRYRFNENEVAPLAIMYQDGKHLRYIMHEYYDNEQLTKDIYEDKIKEIANKSKDLQIMLVELSCERGYVGDGVKWNEFYKLSHDISRYGKNGVVEFETKAEACWSDSFYELPSHITTTYVDNEELYRLMLQVLKEHDVAGIDCEQQSNNKLSTIQIAVKDRVFIIDTVTLEDWLPKDLWMELCNNFFNNANIVKLGIAILRDVDTISAALGIKLLKNSGYIDLNSLVKKCFHKVPGFKLPYQDEEDRIAERHEIGLSAMTKLCLGKGLNKSFAISNWSIRPLRAQQINYAAIDAYCALAIFNVINDLLMQRNLTYKTVNAEMKKPMNLKKK